MKQLSLYILRITALLLFGIGVSVSSASPHANIPPTKVPAYFPGDGVSVRFLDGEFFTFLWPEQWSKKSALSLVLAPINEGQTKEDAIVSNTPIFQEEGILTYYTHYPLDAPPLMCGEYVWQLRNANGRILLTTSFRIDSLRDSRYDIVQPGPTWVYTMEKLDGSCHKAYDKVLQIHYYEPYTVGSGQKLRFCIYDSERRIVLKTDENGLVTEYASHPVSSPGILTGENWLNIMLGNNCNYEDIYYLEVWDSKGGKSFLRFRCAQSTPRLVPDH